VQVFRLVTEDTIEQKVVERAQQKLKLDAMVVQQGRLKDKDKLSREELLDAVRFGADKIFKSKESSITDDDVSLLPRLLHFNYAGLFSTIFLCHV
jgi:SWI/SNF-related matrix-associated actin-dependent regulator of chromatin subfamily A member 5